jgi:hypothetical protein
MRWLIRSLAATAALAGCAPSVPRVPLDLTRDQAMDLALAAQAGPIEGAGRLAVRSQEGRHDLTFDISYDGGDRLRLDLVGTGLFGLVRREGTLLVRGDSAWVAATADDEDLAAQVDLGGRGVLGLEPRELVDILVGGCGPLRATDPEIVAFGAAADRRGYTFTLARGRRLDTLTIDAEHGDLTARTISLGGEPVLEIAYSRYGPAGSGRRPARVEFDHRDGVAGRVAFTRQRVGASMGEGIFETPPGARLVTPLPANLRKADPRGTFSSEGGGRGAWRP